MLDEKYEKKTTTRDWRRRQGRSVQVTSLLARKETPIIEETHTHTNAYISTPLQFAVTIGGDVVEL